MALSGGSNSLRSRPPPNEVNTPSDFGSPRCPEVTDAHPGDTFEAVLESYLLGRRVGNYPPRTVAGYAGALQRCTGALGVGSIQDVTSLGIRRYLTGLHETMKPVSVHYHVRPRSRRGASVGVEARWPSRVGVKHHRRGV